MSFFICHYVILSYKNHQFLSSSLCYSVFKKHLFLSVTLLFCLQKKHLSPSVTLLFCLQKKHLSLSVTLLFCLQKNHLSPFVIMSLCLQKISVSLSVPLLFCLKTPQLVTEAGPAVVDVISFLSVLYQYFISCATSSPTTFLQYILFDKVVEITSCGIL